MFVPFAADAKAEREASGDPRLSLEERYADHTSYITAVESAAQFRWLPAVSCCKKTLIAMSRMLEASSVRK